MHVESENESEKQTDREIREATGGLYVCFYNDCLSDCVRTKGGVKRKRRVKNPHTPFFYVSSRLSHYRGVGRSREREGDSITESTREKSNGRRGKPLHNAFESEAREAASENDVKGETERSSEGGRETLRLGELTPPPLSSPVLSSPPSPPSSLLQELVCRSGEYSVIEAT